MSTPLDEQINQLKQTIADIESQRSILGDAAVEASLKPIHKKLADLQVLAESERKEPVDIPQRKRKLVTLLYLDVVGSTAMTQHLDPEDTLEIMDNALPRLASPIESHGGHVTRFTGDGFKAVFGDPISREDDPEQAIRAGLKILDISRILMKEVATDWGIEDFQVRIGIDTGLAALGGQTEAEDTVMGRVVNLAVRIESAAPAGGLLISHNTYRHVRGVFNVEPKEPIIAKGFPDPIPVYLVESIKPRAFRVQTRGVEGIETRMVGRNDELKFLQHALLTALEEGEGQVVTISGEAGVGKSRLLSEFENWIELLPPSQDVRFFQGRGRPEAQGLPYSLLRDMFAFRFQILDDDSGEQARHKIEIGFCDVFGGDDEGLMRAHILGQLLGFDFSASPHLKGVLNDAEQLHNRGLMYLVQYFQELSQEMPVVIFFEDIHWVDDSSLNLVNLIGEHIPQMRVLIVCAARPILFERYLNWFGDKNYQKHLELDLLSEQDSNQLMDEILKLVEEIPPNIREVVISKAEGNPFYMEELIKMLIEDGVIIPDNEIWRIELKRIEQVNVPSTLAGVLQARLDSLPIHERKVLQKASVVGRLFWDRVVTYIQAEEGDGDDPKLIPRVLSSLKNRELVYRHEVSTFSEAVEYIFRHDLLREVTYESVLKRLRKTYHGLVADWLIANCGDRIGEYSGLIAENLALADRKKQAEEYFKRAGESALAAFANIEAEKYFRKSLDQFTNESLLAESLVGLGESLYRQGKSEEANQFWRQAIDLYKESENYDKLADSYARFSYWTWYQDNREAWELCQEGLELLKGAPDSPGYARLLAEAGRTAYFRKVTDQVVPFCQRAVEMAKRLEIPEIQADARITQVWQQDENAETKIQILEEVIQLTEANALLRTAARAHVAISLQFGVKLIDLKSALEHNLRAADIALQIGQIDGMMICAGNVYDFYVNLGELKKVDQELIEFFRKSSVAETVVQDFFQVNHPTLLFAKGEWNSAIEEFRLQHQKLQHRGNYQLLANSNLSITNTLLELNRFGSIDDMAEAEEALKENININSERLRSNFLLAIVRARQRNFSTAHFLYTQVSDELGHDTNNLFKELGFSVEFDIASGECRWRDAIVACESSIMIFTNCSHRWGWARRLIDLGDALMGRNEPGDLEQAQDTYQQSLDMFTEMGAPGYIKVLEERIEKL